MNNSKKSIYGDKPGSTVSKGNSNGLIKEISSADAEMIKAATAIKKAATPAAPLTENSDVASIKPEAEKDLMKVRSITRTAPKGDDASASETSSTLVPIYTVKERGNIGMGDFEAMKAKVASNRYQTSLFSWGQTFFYTSATFTRPSELVYTFEVPKVLKSSQLVLDVSER